MFATKLSFMFSARHGSSGCLLRATAWDRPGSMGSTAPGGPGGLGGPVVMGGPSERLGMFDVSIAAEDELLLEPRASA